MACISGFTLGGYYNYIDCCGINQTGLSPGLESVCIDQTYSGTTVGVLFDSGSTCTQNCNQGPFNYTFQVTGICSAVTGTVVINGVGGILPYTITPISPLGSGLSTQTGNDPFTYTGLTGGTYVFRINDTTGPTNNELYFNVDISDCFVANIYDLSGTTCGFDNGEFKVSATSTSSPYSILLYKDSVFNQLQTTNSLPYTFTNLSSGVYYVEIYDYGFSTAKTENVVISGSVGPDFGFWKVDSSTCVITGGKLSATGVTGNGPFTYLWSNGETTQTITGLTEGTYSCTITDSLGCSTTKREVVGSSLPFGVGLVTSVNPSCFTSDGSYTYTFTGGTRPIYYSAATGQVGYTFGDTVTLNNLSSGSYDVYVRDANFCPLQLNAFVSPQNGFNVVNTIVTNSNCNSNNGSIYVQLQGLGGFYTYNLSGQNTNYVFTTTTQDQFYTFNNLSNDNYLLIISGSGTNCFYNNNVTVNSTQKFDLTVTTTNSSCGLTNGSASINVGSGYTGVLDYILSDGQSVIDYPYSSYTFNNLSPGSYTINVVDQDGCSVSESFNIVTTNGVLSSVITTNCTNGSNGEAEVVIYQGEPTFSYQWSSNVPGTQTGSIVTGLTAGTYSVIVTDDNGCQSTQKFNIVCTGNLLSGYEIINICNNKFTTTTANKRGFSEMLNEGFVDLTSGYTNCYFSSATFSCDIEINGSAFTQTFYTATTLNDFPQDTLWQSTIENILSSISEVSEYKVDVITNTIKIKSNCNGDYDPLSDAEISLALTINYNIYCLEP
jgi:uncharacterized protein (DUF2141 family)